MVNHSTVQCYGTWWLHMCKLSTKERSHQSSRLGLISAETSVTKLLMTHMKSLWRQSKLNFKLVVHSMTMSLRTFIAPQRSRPSSTSPKLPSVRSKKSSWTCWEIKWRISMRRSSKTMTTIANRNASSFWDNHTLILKELSRTNITQVLLTTWTILSNLRLFLISLDLQELRGER